MSLIAREMGKERGSKRVLVIHIGGWTETARRRS
jgi:hypothetical protein